MAWNCPARWRPGIALGNLEGASPSPTAVCWKCPSLSILAAKRHTAILHYSLFILHFYKGGMFLNIFDIMGPIMVGPSSSHTAGAARMGRVARHLLGSQPVKADIQLHGSFAATGSGHGTDRAIVAGLLDLAPDHPGIPHSFELARQAGMAVSIRPVDLPGAHPNTAVLHLTDQQGRTLTVSASSLGGGRIRVNAIDGMEASFSGELPTLIIRNQDRPGIVSQVSQMLSDHMANIATMQLYRDRRGGLAVMVLECDNHLSPALVQELSHLDGVEQCTYLNMEGC